MLVFAANAVCDLYELRGPTILQGSTNMSGDREAAVRKRAHEIWVSEGQPEGAGERHWAQAEAEIDAAASKPAKKAPAKAAAAKKPAAKKPAGKAK